ncbi:MAG: NADH:flavin oxidoreductase [Pseudomonadota bacterium]
MSTASLDSLLSPVQLGALSLNNRVVMAPMTRTMSPGNVPGDASVAYYRKRAAGGVGLIITEGTCVGHVAANGYPRVPFFHGDEALAAWGRVREAVHAAGGRIMPQLWHVGSVRRPGTEPDPEVPGFGPSGMARPGKVTGHAMTESDIADVIAAFATAARDAERLGFDGVEVHGAHGYLIDQFFWGGTNHRDDGWGGDAVARTRFASEIIRAIRAEVRADFPVLLRWSQWKQQDYGARLADTPDALERFLAPLTDAGVDVFHCSQRRFWEPEFQGSDLNLAGWVKKLSGKPTVTVGSVGLDGDFIVEGSAEFREAQPASIDGLLERLAAAEFDLVAVGRALIANPDWPTRLRQGQAAALKPYTKSLLQTLD